MVFPWMWGRSGQESPLSRMHYKRRRGEANRLGFAVHLDYFRYPGRIIGVDKAPPEDMLRFIADQIGGRVEDFHDYARRAQTRREHLGELRASANLRLAREDDARASFKAALEEATVTDRGDAIVTAMIVNLRTRGNLLPSPMQQERLAPGRVSKAHRALKDDLDHEKTKGLTSLIEVDDESHTPLAWLREWSEASRQKNLVGIIERLQSMRKLGVGPDRENRIHRARYAAIARETAILSAQHLSRFDTHRRLAALVVFAREMESTLTDAGITMFDKMLGGVFRSAENAHKENIVDRAKTLDASTRALIGMAKAMLAVFG
jgi:hypothetical protein